MTVEVLVVDEQTDHPLDAERWVRLAGAVLADEEVRGDVEFTLHFVDEPSIAGLNEQFLGHVGATDVLSFPIDGRPDAGRAAPGSPPVLLGDVVICPAVAFRNAPNHAGSFDAELALLVVHGILHLLGMDHEETGEALAMEDRERVLLARHGEAVAGGER